MPDSHGPLPYDYPELEPGDPGFEERRAINRAGQQNFEFYLEHEAEIFEHHRDDIAIVYDGGRVAYCADTESAADFLRSLTEAQRSAAQLCTYLPSDVAWAL